MPGAVLFDDILNVVRLESLLELSPGYKVFDLLSEKSWTARVQQLECEDNWLISGSRKFRQIKVEQDRPKLGKRERALTFRIALIAFLCCLVSTVSLGSRS